VHLATMR